ncbi:haloacid dehalogenase-like hydrolase family protein [Lyngbya aestuarii BL J]|uniref:Haloacid dehalogenase-like hydrolase family protein n=2 Tax=Lyngbya aestuarii TaxID=118322 RepID=U7QHU9_9CYAN|nr:haloacid dehalogenase-like hydrolase family protein [Lyngbya aestuarii BL J]
MAGTTVQDNNEVQDCFCQAAEITGLKVDSERINSMMGWSKKLVFQTLWSEQMGTDNQSYAPQVEQSYTRFKQILEHHYLTQSVEPTVGCLELFHGLKQQRIKIALNTGFYRTVTNIILHRLGWNQGLNSDYVGSDDTIIQVSVTPDEIYNNEGRPAPYMIQKAMYKLGIKDSKKVIHIGDTPVDLAAGMNANCLLSLAVTNGTHTREKLQQYPNHGLLNSLIELKNIIINL